MALSDSLVRGITECLDPERVYIEYAYQEDDYLRSNAFSIFDTGHNDCKFWHTSDFLNSTIPTPAISSLNLSPGIFYVF